MNYESSTQKLDLLQKYTFLYQVTNACPRRDVAILGTIKNNSLKEEIYPSISLEGARGTR